VASVRLSVTLDLLPNSCHESSSLKGKGPTLAVCALRQSFGYPRKMEKVSEGEESRPHPDNGWALGTPRVGWSSHISGQ